MKLVSTTPQVVERHVKAITQGPREVVVLAVFDVDDLNRAFSSARAAKSGLPQHELGGEDAQRPPFHRICVALARDELRREVVRRAAGRVSLADDKLREAHVHDLYGAVLRVEHVLGLEVAVVDS